MEAALGAGAVVEVGGSWCGFVCCSSAAGGAGRADGAWDSNGDVGDGGCADGDDGRGTDAHLCRFLLSMLPT